MANLTTLECNVVKRDYLLEINSRRYFYSEDIYMEQRTLKIGDRVIYCYEDGSVEFLSTNNNHKNNPLRRTFGTCISCGYKGIQLVINGITKSFSIHRLIAMAFHPNPNNLPQVDHINRHRNDNKPCNLRWVSAKENSDNQHKVDSALQKYGVRHCDNKKLYQERYGKQYNASHVSLHATQPNGKETRYHFSSTSDPIYVALKPLSQKDRYYKYISLKNSHQEESAA